MGYEASLRSNFSFYIILLCLFILQVYISNSYVLPYYVQFKHLHTPLPYNSSVAVNTPLLNTPLPYNSSIVVNIPLLNTPLLYNSSIAVNTPLLNTPLPYNSSVVVSTPLLNTLLPRDSSVAVNTALLYYITATLLLQGRGVFSRGMLAATLLL